MLDECIRLHWPNGPKLWKCASEYNFRRLRLEGITPLVANRIKIFARPL
jgi:hypothetical protein